VILRDAKVSGYLDISRANFAKRLLADKLTVEEGFFADEARFLGDFNLTKARIDELVLYGAAVTRLDLTDTNVSSGLIIVDLAWYCTANQAHSNGGEKPMHWRLGTQTGGQKDCGVINLRNAHIGTLEDSNDAWPPYLQLEGFRLDHLGGGFPGDSNDMRARSPGMWADWLARDPSVSTQQYDQLAGVLLTSGNRSASYEVQYAERERERQQTWQRHDWGQWAWLTTLWAIAGYGIGLYVLHVVWLVLGLALLGAIVLWFSPIARPRGLTWRFGASLHRVLPVVQLSKEFDSFFENPDPAHIYEPRNLTRWQAAFFACLAAVGWISGLFLTAKLWTL
jgi:hypothetical protein